MVHEEKPENPILDERRSTRRVEMEKNSGRAWGWPFAKNTALFLVLALVYGGLVWCATNYLPRIEKEYRAKLGGDETAEEAERVFRLAGWLSDRTALALSPYALLALLEGAAIRTRRWALFDWIYFVLTALLAFAFLFGYVSLAVPLYEARP